MLETITREQRNKLGWILKGCPRCSDGDLFFDKEEGYHHCLQCGFINYNGDTPLPFTRALWHGKPGDLERTDNYD